ncbi:hypothetical protein [uncultured Algibacter sp.]|uniref:hypothetical protein n=1 Tax=uncultured Algibacter sp. TaxID=298659 RepID=UPI0026201BB5|nr:hypothetical protein [uncultured Algibacter sp.]
MTETFELRYKPLLKIKLDGLGIEITDASRSKNCGSFSFKNIINIELTPKKTDWFVTTLSWILDLFVASGGGENYKNEANIKLKTVNHTLKIWLQNVDFEKAETIVKLIKDKITT